MNMLSSFSAAVSCLYCGFRRLASAESSPGAREGDRSAGMERYLPLS